MISHYDSRPFLLSSLADERTEIVEIRSICEIIRSPKSASLRWRVTSQVSHRGRGIG